MKKFFSLMLAVLLLVSALPFAASAAEPVPVGSATCGATANGKHIWNPDTKVVFDPTCTAAGYEDYTCTTGGCGAHGRIEIPALGHDLKATTTAATCVNPGNKHEECQRTGCTYTNDTPIAAAGHTMDAGVVTTAAGCATTGVKTFTCTACDYSYTEEIAATGNHAYVNGACKHCGVSDGLVRSEVYFYINNVAGVNKIYKQIYTANNPYTVPTAELISNYEFKGWYEGENGSGDQLTSGTAWDADENTTWYAWYVYNPNKDGMSTITVTARCYIDGIGNSYLDVPVLTQALPDNTNVFDWLTANKNTSILNSVYAKVDTTKYEWKNRYFYNHNGNEVLTEQTVFANGPKAILIKLEEKNNTTRANVQLYLHTSTTAANPFRILDMNGYTSGMNVTRDAAANLVKQYYNYKTIGNLFTESDWNALQNGESVAGRTSVYISDNGTYKIHVVVTNASSKSSSTADSSNPKTGDYITIAVGTMVMAAAAFITLAEMKKRKMI